ncbi:MAG: hypothetical protein ABSG07_11065, partial [Terriglobales bacterium]
MGAQVLRRVPHPNVAPFATLGWDSTAAYIEGFSCTFCTNVVGAKTDEDIFIDDDPHHWSFFNELM